MVKAGSGAEGRAAGRRGLLGGAGVLLAFGLGGCGFRPIHGGAAPDPTGAEADLAQDLAAVRVPVIPERFGQLLRRGLQRRLGAGEAAAAAARYELAVGPSLAGEAVGFLRDGSATRVRYLATANWTLARLAPREPVANGFERALDAFNVLGTQYFASDISREAAERRLAEQLADSVVLRVAAHFRAARNGEAPRLIAPVESPPTLPDPPQPPMQGGALGPGPDEREGGLRGGIGR